MMNEQKDCSTRPIKTYLISFLFILAWQTRRDGPKRHLG